MSEIRVDAIKTRAGAVPKASDIGLNVTGTILKFQKVTFTTEFQTQNDSFTDITNATLSYTPIASDSTLRITTLFHIYFWSIFLLGIRGN